MFKKGGNKDPLFSTLSIMILVFGGIFNYILDQFNLYQFFPGKVRLLVLFGLVFGLMYFTITHRKRYLEIEKRYDNESKRSKILGVFYLVLLAFITIGAYFGMFILV